MDVGLLVLRLVLGLALGAHGAQKLFGWFGGYIRVMLVALVTTHWENGFFAASNGIGLPLLYMTAALALDVAGPGRYSLDGLFGLRTQPQTVVAWSAIAIAVVTALAKVAVRRPRPNHVQTHA